MEITGNTDNNQELQHVFILGSKGIPANYGGFETFVEKLTDYKKSNRIHYHVACIGDSGGDGQKAVEFQYHAADCFCICPWNIGPAKAIAYDVAALRYCITYIKKHSVLHPVIYVLACRIGPFIGYYKRQIKRLGGVLYVNPDGHEWKRAKWSLPVRQYWKWSEGLMVKHADLMICDSRNIELYIKKEYGRYNPDTEYISYGAEVEHSTLPIEDQNLQSWYSRWGITPGTYYLVVGRFVPENNFETMLREFMESKTEKKLVLITGAEGNSFYERLLRQTGFDQDARIVFVGTLYDQELLKKIREEAYAYLHGHEVGGTNPSLLEALGSTKLNLLLDVGFNREVAEDGALYWTKDAGSLARLIGQVDNWEEKKLVKLGQKARARIVNEYSWDSVVEEYERCFLRKSGTM